MLNDIRKHRIEEIGNLSSEDIAVVGSAAVKHRLYGPPIQGNMYNRVTESADIYVSIQLNRESVVICTTESIAPSMSNERCAPIQLIL